MIGRNLKTELFDVISEYAPKIDAFKNADII